MPPAHVNAGGVVVGAINGSIGGDDSQIEVVARVKQHPWCRIEQRDSCDSILIAAAAACENGCGGVGDYEVAEQASGNPMWP